VEGVRKEEFKKNEDFSGRCKEGVFKQIGMEEERVLASGGLVLQ
jgi:hypothetical protein